MSIVFEETSRPSSVNILNAVFTLNAAFLELLNQFRFTGPGHWANARLSGLEYRADIRVYGPNEMVEGDDVYGTLTAHTDPQGNMCLRLILVPVLSARKHLAAPAELTAWQFARVAFTWLGFSLAWRNENIDRTFPESDVVGSDFDEAKFLADLPYYGNLRSQRSDPDAGFLPAYIETWDRVNEENRGPRPERGPEPPATGRPRRAVPTPRGPRIEEEPEPDMSDVADLD